jgi:hypothetical protein
MNFIDSMPLWEKGLLSALVVAAVVVLFWLYYRKKP